MTTELIAERVKVTSLVDGTEANAMLLKCPACRNPNFMVLLIGPEEHSHLQCCGCGQSYCDGGCAKEAQPPKRRR